jgi:Chitobiase/beta-hexosaminidase C-terminal domain
MFQSPATPSMAPPRFVTRIPIKLSTQGLAILGSVLVVMSFAVPSASAWGQAINCPSGFSSTGSCGVAFIYPLGQAFSVVGSTNGSTPVLSGSQVDLVPRGAIHNAMNMNYSSAVNVQAFSTSFTFVANGWNIALVLQNNTNTNAFLGTGANFTAGAGCEGSIFQAFPSPPPNPYPNNLFALNLDSGNGNTAGSGTFTYSHAQIYQPVQTPCNPNDNQNPYVSPQNKVSTSPVPLNSPASTVNTTTGDTYSATIVYTGTNVTLNLYDVTAGGSCPGINCFTHTWTGVSIPSIVNGTTAYVGLAGATNAASTAPLLIDSLVYTVLSAAATPTASVPSDTYASTQSVTLSDSSSGSVMCYNLTGAPYTDGNGNCPNGTKVTGAISVAAGQSIFVVAGSGSSAYGDSPVASYTYQIGSTTAQPTFSLATASYNGAQTAFISASTAGSSIYYTTDGSTPTTGSTLYTGPVTISSTTTLKAVANVSSAASTVSSITATINPFAIAADSPTFSPVPGTYTGTQSVTLTSSTSGSNICYVLASTPPTLLPQPNNLGGCTVGTQYSSPVSVSSSQTLYAIAGTNATSPPSSLVSGTYTIGSGSQRPAPPLLKSAQVN